MKIVPAQIEHLAWYQDFLNECFEDGIIKYAIAVKNPKLFLKKVIADSQNENIAEKSPRTSTYFYIENEEILGAIRYRHGTNAFIERVIGHAGYETKPSARGKGVARSMLSWLQRNVLRDNIIITCETDNIASQKVIESCGASFINQFFSHEKNNYVSRFQLPATSNVAIEIN